MEQADGSQFQVLIAEIYHSAIQKYEMSAAGRDQLLVRGDEYVSRHLSLSCTHL